MAVKDDKRDEEERDDEERDDEEREDEEREEEEAEKRKRKPSDGDASERGASVPPPVSADEAPNPDARPAPLWVVPLYVIGLILVYLGERVLEPMPNGHWI